MRLADMEAVPWKGSMTWHPVRAQLGIRAFGAAAFSAREAGDLVVEPHTEQDGRGHEELYLVVEGRARFRVGDDEVEAEAGTFVFVGDPSLHREAVALEPGTSVLVLGVPSRCSSRPARSTWRGCARGSTTRRPRSRSPRRGCASGASPGAMYAAALAAAAAGDLETARTHLRAAIAALPGLADEAQRDDVLRDVR